MKILLNEKILKPYVTPTVTLLSVAATAPFLSGKKENSENDIKTIGDVAKNNFIATQNIKKIDLNKPLPQNKQLYVISGSSGVGKDFVLRKLLAKHPELKLSVSYTTRPMRPGEKDGIDYNFISSEDFDKALKNNDFLEYVEIYGGIKYGTKKSTVEKSLENNDIVILKLDTKGAINIKRMIPGAKIIFLDLDPKIIESRLRGRGTETEDAIQKRLGAIRREKEDSKQFDYIIDNENSDNTVKILEKMFGICD